jgi:hypothetical protein
VPPYPISKPLVEVSNYSRWTTPLSLLLLLLDLPSLSILVTLLLLSPSLLLSVPDNK